MIQGLLALECSSQCPISLENSGIALNWTDDEKLHLTTT